MTTTSTRRTVAGMDERLQAARERIVERIAQEQADMDERLASGKGYDSGYNFAHGAKCGFEGALHMLDWAFSAENDWMYPGMGRRG